MYKETDEEVLRRPVENDMYRVLKLQKLLSTTESNKYTMPRRHQFTRIRNATPLVALRIRPHRD